MSVFTTPHPRSHRRHGTARPLRAAAGTAALLTLAACGGGDGSRSSSSPAAAAGGIGKTSTSLGTILTDSAGMTLYAFAADQKGICLTYWPPVPAKTAPKDPSGVTAHLGVLTRSDGTKQLTVDGWPMYTYVGDHASGDTSGQGTNLSGGLWWVVGPDGSWIKDAAGSSGPSSPSYPQSQGNGGY
jgi:predicted lipoprotein with Yx(FWY)xxD motif